MRAGDRVTTPRGDGVITSIHTDHRWAFRRTTPTTYVIVRIDGHPYGQVLLPDQVQPLDKERTMSDTETETITAQTEEPDPAPDPEPDTDNGDEGEEELTQWP